MDKKSYAINVGRKLLDEFEMLKPMLKENGVYTSFDVMRICGLTNNVFLYSEEVKKIENPTKEEMEVIRDVSNISEWIDALLSGRTLHQSIMPKDLLEIAEEVESEDSI